ncbi:MULTISPECIES: DUF3987 domain-containing protein [unclassified Aliiroseovarius]|uniref:DUF3987 domain-containing protein n=1 Tax=unclassified Aliiroseovarius TaxID=2623558 RepID=UPI00156983F4|nr:MULTISPECIES: DUF3987 domain-containing protein [unclassified Aliiroseovarius]NRP31688.1 hypothetical protein [Aliiroseovarius sp. xm-m-314]NRP45956.1 hypothetical protein [Aliiroseovarius sp. xm-m-378]NRP66824.1 hypothetical protein [Aliiroseovarius sp. xm-v-225]NRP81330.1 hypothetical protein [Aliiroseovarius sp. xm-v-209]NRP93888.1 hypothetical protein [Aliiroseovarius sp. xm-a-134]
MQDISHQHQLQGDSDLEDLPIEMQTAAILNMDPEVTPISVVAGMPVKKFDFDLLPNSLTKWVKDTQNRLQCPPDFIAVSAMIGLAAVAGNKYKIKPKALDSDWSVVPNLWGLLIGSPSSKKTPALNAGLYHVLNLDKTARNNKERLVVHDSTIERIQILQSENPTGLLLVNDEIAAMFKSFDSQNRSNDRPYLLQAFNGDRSYSVDRVGRDSIHIPENTLSLIGNIQPKVLEECFGRAGNLDDGFMQRLQLAVYPDVEPSFRLIDDIPDSFALDDAKSVYQDIYDYIGRDLGFDTEPQIRFSAWYEENARLAQAFEDEGRDDLASHLLKYPALVASLALLIELADNFKSPRISKASLDKAIGWSEYLFSHAKRIYKYGDKRYITAKLLLDKRRKLTGDFSPSEITQKGWKDLKKLSQINEAIEVLVKHNYLILEERTAKETGGKPSMRYRWNETLEE